MRNVLQVAIYIASKGCVWYFRGMLDSSEAARAMAKKRWDDPKQRELQSERAKVWGKLGGWPKGKKRSVNKEEAV